MTRVSLTRGDLGRASPALCPLNLVSYSALTIASLPFSWRECRSRNIFLNDGSTNGLWAILLWSNDRVQKQPGPEIRRVATFRHQPLTNGGPRPGNISLLTGLVLTGLLEIVCSLQTAQSRHHCPVWRNSALLPPVQAFWGVQTTNANIYWNNSHAGLTAYEPVWLQIIKLGSHSVHDIRHSQADVARGYFCFDQLFIWLSLWVTDPCAVSEPWANQPPASPRKPENTRFTWTQIIVRTKSTSSVLTRLWIILITQRPHLKKTTTHSISW